MLNRLTDNTWACLGIYTLMLLYLAAGESPPACESTWMGRGGDGGTHGHQDQPQTCHVDRGGGGGVMPQVMVPSLLS
jgi:hypothetical protein